MGANGFTYRIGREDEEGIGIGEGMKRVGDGKGVFHRQEAGSVKITDPTKRKWD
jgi:hypothetical protein